LSTLGSEIWLLEVSEISSSFVFFTSSDLPSSPFRLRDFFSSKKRVAYPLKIYIGSKYLGLIPLVSPVLFSGADINRSRCIR
jgi:hypothetical protein